MAKSFAENYTNLKKEIDLSKTAILIVDMVNDFCTQGGKMVLEDGYLVVEPIKKLVDAGRAHGMPIVWVCQEYRVGKYDKVTEKRIGTCYAGSWGSQLIDAFEIKADDYVVKKRRYSGFFQSDLDITLNDMGAQKVIVTGCVTNICIRGTVADAFQLGYEVFVPKDCVRATAEREQLAHLWDIETHFGTVCESSELILSMDKLTPEQLCRIHD
jgi:ureidoacrylate peracid hydrolase